MLLGRQRNLRKCASLSDALVNSEQIFSNMGRECRAGEHSVQALEERIRKPALRVSVYATMWRD